MKVLVVGATGPLGADIVRKVVQHGASARGLVRRGSPKETEVRSIAGEVVYGDLLDQASLEAACNGVDVIVATATAIVSKGSDNSLANVDGDGYQRLIAIAKQAGIKKFVHVSVSPNLSETCQLVRHKRATERALRASGLKYCILQPSCFMEIWLAAPVGWFPEQGKAQVFGSGDGPISYISRDDVGSWAAAAIKEARTDNQVIPLGGPRAVSPNEAVRIFEQAIGQPLKVTRVPGLVPKVASVVLKAFNPKMASLMALGAQTLAGDVIDMSKAHSLAEVHETSVEDYARKVAANLRTN